MKKILIILFILCGELGSLYIPLSGSLIPSLSQEISNISTKRVNELHEDGYTLLHKVIISSYIGDKPLKKNEVLTSVKLLIQKSADVNCKIPEGECLAGVTPLYIAVLRGLLSVVKLLIQSRAQVNAVIDNDGSNALILAAHIGRHDMIMCLLDHHADVNAKFQNRFNIFHILSANKGHDKVILALLAREETHEHLSSKTLDGIIQEALIIANEYSRHKETITVLTDDYSYARNKQREIQEKLLEVLFTSPESSILPKDVIKNTIYSYLSFRDFMKRVPQLI